MNNGFFYLGCRNPQDHSGGIYGFDVDNNGKLQQKFFQELHGCSYMAYSPDRKILYAACADGKAGAAAAFSIQSDRSLKFINQLPTQGVSTCYIIAAPGGKYLYTTSYFTSNLTEFSLNSDGSLKQLERVITFSGSGPDERQDVPHPHFVNFTPDGKKLIVVDLGLDEIKLFNFDPARGLLNADSPQICKVVQPGSGPRHLVFNASGNVAYLINEIGNTVSVLKYDSEKFTHLQTISTRPADCQCYSKTAAVRLSPDGRFLFGSNRGYDSIAVFKVQVNGLLELHDIVSAGGEGPRDINFLPGGNFFAAANEMSGNTVFFEYNADNGKLTQLPESFNFPGPLAIYW